MSFTLHVGQLGVALLREALHLDRHVALLEQRPDGCSVDRFREEAAEAVIGPERVTIAPVGRVRCGRAGREMERKMNNGGTEQGARLVSSGAGYEQQLRRVDRVARVKPAGMRQR